MKTRRSRRVFRRRSRKRVGGTTQMPSTNNADALPIDAQQEEEGGNTEEAKLQTSDIPSSSSDIPSLTSDPSLSDEIGQEEKPNDTNSTKNRLLTIPTLTEDEKNYVNALTDVSEYKAIVDRISESSKDSPTLEDDINKEIILKIKIMMGMQKNEEDIA